MPDPSLTLVAAIAGLAAVAILALATLSGWRGWLALRRFEIEQRGGAAPVPSAASRIEIADLRERLRKLEAIAAGVEL